MTSRSRLANRSTRSGRCASNTSSRRKNSPQPTPPCCSPTHAETNGRRIVVRALSDRDLNFVKLLAQKLTRLSPNAIALLATTSPQPSLVFAQSAGQPFDMGALMKETMAKLGGRGGGSKDMAQGGIPNAEGIEADPQGNSRDARRLSCSDAQESGMERI